MGEPTEGLRERKKRAARAAIAATARRLFAQRGYDAVTVAEIATAAEVSEKTVFNYFATKEDLAFAGSTSPSPAETRTSSRWPRSSAAAARYKSAWPWGWESGAAAITAAITQTSGANDDDLIPAIVARTLWFTHRSIFLAALHGLLAQQDREQLAAQLRAAADRAYDQLANGRGDYGRNG